jgi:hypothetical protein
MLTLTKVNRDCFPHLDVPTCRDRILAIRREDCLTQYTSGNTTLLHLINQATARGVGFSVALWASM